MKVKKLNLVIILISLIGIIGYVGLTESQNMEALMHKLDFKWIIGTLFLMIMYWFLETLILHLVTKKLHPIQKFKSTLQTTMIGQFFNCITPFSSGGQPMQALHMVKTGVPFGRASSCLLTKFIVYQVVLTLYSLVVLFIKLDEFSAKINGFTYMVLFGFIVNTLVVLALLSIGCFKRVTIKVVFKIIDILGKWKMIKHVNQKRHYVLKEFNSFYKSFDWMRHHKQMIFYMVVLSAIQLTVYFLVPYFILKAFGLHASILSMISAQAFVLMISSFIPLPGAAGGAELSFFTFFRLFFPANLLNISVLVWRMVTFYLTICIGMCFTLWQKDGTNKTNITEKA